MNEVWFLNGHDDDGNWDVEVFSSYEKARKSFDYYVDEYNEMWGDAENKVEVNDDYASYDFGNHFGNFWIEKTKVY